MAYEKVTEVTIDGAPSVILFQNKAKRFRVNYGLQTISDLGYSAAAKEFGCCVFHALACAGLLDNNGPE